MYATRGSGSRQRHINTCWDAADTPVAAAQIGHITCRATQRSSRSAQGDGVAQQIDCTGGSNVAESWKWINDHGSGRARLTTIGIGDGDGIISRGSYVDVSTAGPGAPRVAGSPAGSECGTLARTDGGVSADAGGGKWINDHRSGGARLTAISIGDGDGIITCGAYIDGSAAGPRAPKVAGSPAGSECGALTRTDGGVSADGGGG